MDALTLLRRVSEAYRSLASLAVQASIVTESGDEDNNQRSSQRVDFYYAAPDRIRYEPRGKIGILQVSDGNQLHTLFRNPRGDNRYAAMPAARVGPVPSSFRADIQFSGGTAPFLYQAIHESVAAAELLREENGAYVVSVTYDAPARPHMMVGGSATRFWIEADTYRVLRQEGEVGHRFPTENEVHWTRHAIVVDSIRANEPIPDEIFHFTPPPDAIALPGGRGSIGGGGGFAERRGGKDGDLVEHRGSHEWQGDVLIERSRWKLRGVTLDFERRLAFSGEDSKLHVDERVTGPKGEVRSELDLPLA